jgi:hypothetical protein
MALTATLPPNVYEVPKALLVPLYAWKKPKESPEAVRNIGPL